MPSKKSIALLIRDPLKRNLRAFETGYWRFSEYLTSQRLLKEGYHVVSLKDGALPFVWKAVTTLSKREWTAEYASSLIQTAQLAFSRSCPRIAIAWQGPGFLFVLLRKLLHRSQESTVIIFMYYSYPYKNLQHRLIRLILHKILIDAAIVVCITPSQEKEFARDFKLKPHQIKRVPHGVDSTFFTPQEEGPQPYGDYIFCPGDFDRDDASLLEACMDLDLNIVRVTKEPGYAEKVKRSAEKKGLASKVFVLAKVDALTLRSLYRKSLFVVLPLKNDTHPAGLTSLLEAMACGKATIITQGLTTDGYVQDMEQALYCRMHDAIDLKKKIILLQKEMDLRERIGANARLMVEKNFRIELGADQLMKIIQES